MSELTIAELLDRLTALGAQGVVHAVRTAKTPHGHYRFALADDVCGPYTGDRNDEWLEAALLSPSDQTQIVGGVAASESEYLRTTAGRPQSRLGEDLCPGMPWLPLEHFEAPQGMLERPEGCQFPKRCALDRVCWAAKQRELDAHDRHKRFLTREEAAA